MGLFDFIKSGFNKVMGGVSSGVNKVMDVAKGARDAIQAGYNTVKNIPILGQAVDSITNAPIPFADGKSIQDIAKGVSNAIDSVDSVRNNISGIQNAVNSGDFKGAYNQGIGAYNTLRNIPKNF